MSRRLAGIVLVVATTWLATGCAPATFVRTMEPTWASVEIREDLPYDKAWETVTDLLVRRFDLEVVSKESGYVRTGWLYTWTGQMTENYRVRATIKFTENNKKVDVKSEAHYLSSGGWVIGSDSLLLSTLKTDLMGAVSRTTR